GPTCGSPRKTLTSPSGRPEASTLTSWRCQAYGSTTVPTSRLCGRSSITGKLWRNGIVCSYASSKVKGLKLEPPELYDPRLSGSRFGGGNGTQTEVDDAWARARCWRYTTVCVKWTMTRSVADGNGTPLVCRSTLSVRPDGRSRSSSDDPGCRGTSNTATVACGASSGVRAASACLWFRHRRRESTCPRQGRPVSYSCP